MRAIIEGLGGKDLDWEGLNGLLEDSITVGKGNTVMQTQKVLKIKDVASILSVSERHVQRMVYEGKLPAIHLGPQTIRIPEQSLDEWLNRKTEDAVTTQKKRRRPV